VGLAVCFVDVSNDDRFSSGLLAINSRMAAGVLAVLIVQFGINRGYELFENIYCIAQFVSCKQGWYYTFLFNRFIERKFEKKRNEITTLFKYNKNIVKKNVLNFTIEVDMEKTNCNCW
jgi:hypothetical protein